MLTYYQEAQRKRQSILDAIIKHGPLTQRQIADNSGITYCNVNNLVKIMVNHQEIERLPDYLFKALATTTFSAESAVTTRREKTEANRIAKQQAKENDRQRIEQAKILGNVTIHRWDDNKPVKAATGDRARRIRPANGHSALANIF